MALLNLGDDGFVDVSGVSGFAHDDDARALAVVDWNLDGRLDLFVKNRTGPQLRYLENLGLASGNGFVALQLVGTTTNRDAVGAIVELTAAGRKRLQHVAAGSGYLAQSSSTVHFGLGDASSIDSLTIRWPGGTVETIDPPPINGFFRVDEGSGRAVRTPRTPVEWDLAVARRTQEPGGGGLLLKTPLPLPPSFLETMSIHSGRARPALVNLWAHWCEPCAAEIQAFAAATDRLAARSIDWKLVSLDAPDDRNVASEWLEAQFRSAGNDTLPRAAFLDEPGMTLLESIVEHVTGVSQPLPIPTSLLIDGRGNLQMLYVGPVFIDRFLSDSRTVLDGSMLPARRSLYPGRWYYRSPRNLGQLGETLESAGHAESAAFYRALAANADR